jgi:hypothetical protein
VQEHPATAALRARSPAELHRGLVESLVEGEQEWLKDERDLIVALAPFHDCARRLGLDPATVFDDAAAAAPAALRDTVTTFGRRGDVTPAAFGFVLDHASEGPRYRSTVWPWDESPEDYFRRHGLLDEDQ